MRTCLIGFIYAFVLLSLPPLAGALWAQSACPEAFRRGDADGSGVVDMTDGLWTLSYLYLAGDPPSCFDAADSNDTGDVSIADVMTTLFFLFVGADLIPPPGPFECGPDETQDDLSCAEAACPTAAPELSIAIDGLSPTGWLAGPADEIIRVHYAGDVPVLTDTLLVEITQPEGAVVNIATAIVVGPAQATLAVADLDPPLPDGESSMVASICSASGNAAVSAPVALRVDRSPPEITITEPQNLSDVSADSIRVSGSVDDAESLVTVNGAPATLTAGDPPTFEVDTSLKEGSNRIAVVAVDLAGNVATANLTVNRDTTAPQVVIGAPADGTIVSAAEIDVTGLVTDITVGSVDADDVVVDVNGSPATVTNGSFLLVGLALKPGPNQITVTAFDMAGNSVSQSITVVRQELVGQKIELVSGNNQSREAHTVLDDPLVVRVVDAGGTPISNRPVVFSVTRSNGLLGSTRDALLAGEGGTTYQATSDAQGQTSVMYALGSRVGAGNNRVSATAVGFAGEVVFCFSAEPAPPATIRIVSGNFQTGATGQPLPLPLVVEIRDLEFNACRDIPVTFDVVAGAGNIGGSSSIVVPSDSNGRAAAVLTLGGTDEIRGNVVVATIEAISGTIGEIFVNTGIPVGSPSETRVSGLVLDNSDVPIPNATAHIAGTDLETLTDSEGRFTIEGAPVGAIDLEIFGHTTTRPGTWPTLHFEMTTISGQDNTVGIPIYLPVIDTANGQMVGGSEDVVIHMANMPGLELKVFANSVTCPDGSDECLVSMTQVHRDRVPMPPTAGISPTLVWTLQPAGVQFDPPAQLSYPNAAGFPPGFVVEMFSFDHDLGEFIAIGTGSVSADGSVIVSDPGVGIRKAGWGFLRAAIRRHGWVKGGSGALLRMIELLTDSDFSGGPDNGDPWRDHGAPRG